MSETLKHLKKLEHEIKCYKQIIKELSGYDVVGVGIDIETPAQLADTKLAARLPNGRTASNVYEAYLIGLEQGTRETSREPTNYLTSGDIKYIYDGLGYKSIISKADFEFAKAIEREVLTRNTC